MVKEMAMKIRLLEKRVGQVKELEQKVAAQGRIIEYLMDQVTKCELTSCRKVESDADIIQKNMTALHSGKTIIGPKSGFNRGREIRTGEVPENVAFTAYLDHTLSGLANGMIIRIPSILLNDGNAYNVHTGIFTVPVDGTYLFTFSIVHFNMNQLVAKLVVDNVGMVDAVADSDGREHQSSNTAILRLQNGQSVWLEAADVEDGTLFSLANERYCTFSGVLLY
ncbi:hypothetical protein ACJMK2_033956 [Sinanodonta woodiana]|uniref:C1q domain-containing protein n=1 Tax=Sinanodonta woodiana TaxID=1069815 RepID=A0ABD3WTV5_SINWO